MARPRWMDGWMDRPTTHRATKYYNIEKLTDMDDRKNIYKKKH